MDCSSQLFCIQICNSVQLAQCEQITNVFILFNNIRAQLKELCKDFGTVC